MSDPTDGRERVRLTAADLALIDAGFRAIMQRTSPRERPGRRLTPIDFGDIREEHIWVSPEDIVASTPYVEAGLALAVFAWKAYRAYKSGLEGREEIVSRVVSERLDFRPQHSLDELIEARNQIAQRFMG